MTKLRIFLDGLFAAEGGQDVVEYALLVAFFGVALIAAWSGVVDALKAGHESASAGAEGLWDTPAPGGSPP